MITTVPTPTSLRSHLHRFDPRLKLTGWLAFTVTVIFSPLQSPGKAAALAALLAGPVMLSRLPLRFVWKRLIPLLPFLLFLALAHFIGPDATPARLARSMRFLTRTLLVLTATALMAACTEFADWMAAFRQLRLPQALNGVIFFAHHAFDRVIRRGQKMLLARRARTFYKEGLLRKTKAMVRLLISLLSETMEKGPCLYAAMLARGYRGRISTLHRFRRQGREISSLAIFLLLLAILAWSR